jgi:hypothetical protein
MSAPVAASRTYRNRVDAIHIYAMRLRFEPSFTALLPHAAIGAIEGMNRMTVTRSAILHKIGERQPGRR